MTDRKEKRVALFVGVDEYMDPGIPSLKCAVEDAKALCTFFEEERPGQFDKAEKLENPTMGEMLTAVGRITRELEAGDLFLFYFAGHGTVANGEQQLLCRDSQVGYGGAAIAVPYGMVERRGASYNTAIILDACRTSLSRTRGVAGVVAGRDLNVGFVQNLPMAWKDETGSRTLLYSCDEGESSEELPYQGHGLFTLALLEELGKVSEWKQQALDKELSDRVGQRMVELARNAGRRQHQRPMFTSVGATPMVLRRTLDTEPLEAWVNGLKRKQLIKPEAAMACLSAISGDTEEAGGWCLFELARYFSRLEAEGGGGEEAEKFAAEMIQGLCKMAERERKRPVETAPAPPRPAPEPAAGGAEKGGRGLGREELVALRRFCESVSGVRREELKEIRNARTEGEAVKALERLTLGWVETYGRGNALGRGVSRPLSVWVAADGQALGTEIRHVGDALRTPLQAALLRALNAALSLGERF